MTGLIGKDGKPVGLVGLPRHWQEDVTHCRECDVPVTKLNVAVAQLSAALPKWKLITEDKDTWPEADNSKVLVAGKMVSGEWDYFVYNTSNMRDILEDHPGYFPGVSWRPLCDLDYPPEDSK